MLYDNVAIECLTTGILEKLSYEYKAPIINVLTFLKEHAVFSYGADFNENGKVAAQMAYQIFGRRKRSQLNTNL